MKALTIWQPWASLIMIGAKPYEFRRWDYREREAALEGQRIVIHAGARAIVREEVDDLFERMEDNESSLIDDIAKPLLERVRVALDKRDAAMPAYRSASALYRARMRKPRMVGDPDLGPPEKPVVRALPLAAGLGTAILGKPRKVTALFGGRPDSDRLDQHMWAWPLTDIEVWMPPVEARGAQGFWPWPFSVERAA
jgi:hypothetical protein